jgi:hypothetical protein
MTTNESLQATCDHAFSSALRITLVGFPLAIAQMVGNDFNWEQVIFV